jgi:hypothetical protein
VGDVALLEDRDRGDIGERLHDPDLVRLKA